MVSIHCLSMFKIQRKVFVKKALVVFLAVVSIVGCNQKKPEDTSGSSGPAVGAIEPPKQRNYTAAELTIGRRICSALKHKRELFEGISDMQEKFRVKGELKNCEGPNPYGINEFTVSVSNSSGAFKYMAENRPQKYLQDVITDEDGVMEIFCNAMEGTDNVSNTVLSGSSYLIVNFLIKDSFDRFEVTTKNQNGKIVSTEGVNVVTYANQAAAKFLGVEKLRIIYTPCPNKANDYSYIKQTWVSAVTNF